MVMRARQEFGQFLNRRNLLEEGVEVGVLAGDFSRTILTHWRGTMLHLVDSWRNLDGYDDERNVSDEAHESFYQKTLEAMRPFEGRYQVHRCLSREAVVRFRDHSLDFVYLDADHSYLGVLDDLQLWSPKVRPGGILAGHDFIDGELPQGSFGVRRAVNEFARCHHLRVNTTAELHWPSWYIEVPSRAGILTPFQAPEMLAVTIGIGTWRTVAELSAERARRCTGLSTVILDDEIWSKFSSRYPNPAFMKLHLFDLIEADNIFYFDADAIHLNPWNPHEHANRTELVAVLDPYISDYAWALEEAGITGEDYFNSGVFIANRRQHSVMFERAQEFAAESGAWCLADQGPINRARVKLEIPLCNLGRSFNHLRFFDDPTFDASQTVIAHYTPHDTDPAEVEAFARNLTIVNRRTATVEADRFLETVTTHEQDFAGQGIVTCAGRTKYLICAWVLIRMLREKGCTLPIEVWYLGSEEYDAAWDRLAREWNVTCIDAHKTRTAHPHRRLGGWELKPYAILHSRFEEVLFLDADNVPVRDPTSLFNEPKYQETGAVFWPDQEIFSTPPESDRWRVFGIDCRAELDQESGQLLIDKRRCLRALQLCNWFNEYSDFFYQYVHGDKDTFRFAWHRLEQSFTYIATPATHELHGTISQYDLDGELLFQHRHGAKWSLSVNVRVPGFRDEARCLEFIADLRSQWRPVERIAGPISVDDQKMIAQFQRSRFRCYFRGRRSGRLTFDADNALRSGNERVGVYWWFRNKILIISDADGTTQHQLHPIGDGVWESISTDSGSAEVTLIPV